MTARLFSFFFFAVALALTAAAQPVSAQDAEAERPIARGRALNWGFAAIMPMWIGDVRDADGVARQYSTPGGGMEGRGGFELAGGISLGVVGGVAAHESPGAAALVSYRGAVEARWTIDLGDWLAPSFGLAAGLMLMDLGQGIRVTAYGRLLAGVQIIVASWMAVDVACSIEGALGLDAFRDPVLWASPQLGISFYE